MSAATSLFAARRAGVLLATTFALVTIAGAACRRSAPEAPPTPKAAPGVVEVLKGGRWLFTYVEPSGAFSTTDKPESVPEVARAMVRVFDPADPTKTDVPGQVYVTDLNELAKSGKAPAHPVSREAFETAALAQLPPGDSSALAAHKGGAPTAAPPPPFAPFSGDAGTGPGGTPVVTIYGTSWCGACRAAREYLTQRRVPFADKDVERDPAAARELSDKASKLGIPTDRVPIIDVRGRLLQGFDRARIDALLGRTDMKKTNPLALGSVALAFVFVALGAARPAEARLIDLHAGGTAGGLTGWGTTSGTPDFFDRRKGPGVGVAVGVKLLIFDVSLNFTQLFDSGGSAGTLLQALIGINFDIPVGNQLFMDGIEKGKSRNVLRPIYNVGLASGTPEPVHAPYDNAQISAKGVVSYMGLGYEHFLNEFVGVGAEADFGYHYFIDGGKSMDTTTTMPPKNPLETHSSGYQITGFGTVTFHLGY